MMKSIWAKVIASSFIIVLSIVGCVFVTKKTTNVNSEIESVKYSNQIQKHDFLNDFTVEGSGTRYKSRAHLLENKLNRLKFSGSITVVKDKSVVLKRGFWMSNYSKKVYAGSSTLYHTAYMQLMFSKLALNNLLIKNPALRAKKVKQFVNTNDSTLNNQRLGGLFDSHLILSMSVPRQSIADRDDLKKYIQGHLKVDDGFVNQNQTVPKAALFSYLVAAIAPESNSIFQEVKNSVNLYGSQDRLYIMGSQGLGYIKRGNHYYLVSAQKPYQFGFNNVYANTTDLFDVGLRNLRGQKTNKLNNLTVNQARDKSQYYIHDNGLIVSMYFNTRSNSGFVAISNVAQSKRTEIKVRNALMAAVK